MIRLDCVENAIMSNTSIMLEWRNLFTVVLGRLAQRGSKNEHGLGLGPVIWSDHMFVTYVMGAGAMPTCGRWTKLVGLWVLGFWVVIGGQGGGVMVG